MNFLELSIEKLHEENKKLYEKIKKEYNYDLVIFIAKGAFLIGQDLAELNNTPLLEICATRGGGKLKKLGKPVLKVIPNNLKIFLREKEFKSNYHSKHIDRKITYDTEKWEKYINSKNILLVDDSVDTGYSIKTSKEEIKSFFGNANLKVAALNVFEKSKDIVITDYFLYKDTMIKGPFSNDSKENKEYIKLYNNWM